MIRFDQQVVVVTGSGRGLGAAYATLLAERGAAVVVHDAGVSPEGGGTDPTLADTVVQAIRTRGGTAVACYEHLDSVEACQAVIATALRQFGRLDALIHNAGIVTFTPIEATNRELFARMLHVHVEAPFWLAQAAFPHMKTQRYGRIVLTTSGRAMYLERAQPGLTSYTLGKMAQLGLMNGLAAEGHDWGLRVNAIAPVAATRMLRRHVEPETYRPEQVAPAVVFLASAQCTVSGVILHAANGQFSTAQWVRSSEVTLTPGSLTPEAIAVWFRSVSDAGETGIDAQTTT
jgi:NAD(P)-dependent dehydrogenase (short-subunit alcohol dehydrogenase family)